MDYATMAQDVAAFFQEHNLSKPILFGHSMCVTLHIPSSDLT